MSIPFGSRSNIFTVAGGSGDAGPIPPERVNFIAEVTGWHYFWYTGPPEWYWNEDPYHETLEFCLGTSLQSVGVGHLAVAVDETATIFDFGVVALWPSQYPNPGDHPWQSISDENNQMSGLATVWHLVDETVLWLSGDGEEVFAPPYDGWRGWDIVRRGVTSAAVPHAIGAEVRTGDNDTLGSIEDGGTTLTMLTGGTFDIRWFGDLYDPGGHAILMNGEWPDWTGPIFDLRLNGVAIDSVVSEWTGGEVMHATIQRDRLGVVLEVGDKLQVWAYGDNAPNGVWLSSACSILVTGRIAEGDWWVTRDGGSISLPCHVGDTYVIWADNEWNIDSSVGVEYALTNHDAPNLATLVIAGLDPAGSNYLNVVAGLGATGLIVHQINSTLTVCPE
jgi:hypothetical protein